MKRLIGIIAIAGSLVGCATPQQNAALAGGLIGAVIATGVSQPQPQYRPPVRVIHCNNVVVGYTYYGNPIVRQVCR